MLIKTTNLFVPIVLLLLCSCRPSLASSPAPPEETGLKLEFCYQNESNKGPGAWGTINPNWKTCGQGNLQSPINILDSETQISPDLGDLKIDYQASPASVKNRGHDIMVKWQGNAGTFTVNGTVYSLKQCHWHSPSEHTFNGSSRLLEAHMVHETPNGNIAVVAVTYVSGEADPFLAKIMANITNLQDEKDIGSVDPRNIDLGSKSYYRYIGSLTTPPCTEGVIWTVMKEPRTVSTQQVLALSAAVDKDSRQNARPVQSSKGRKVFVYA